MSSERATVEITWEVYRTHPTLGPDMKVAANMTARQARAFLKECERDCADLPQLSFYRVKATTTRERIDGP